MPNTTYLGTAQFGTETFHTEHGRKVTFTAGGVNFDVQTKGHPPAPAKKSDAISSRRGLMGERCCFTRCGRCCFGLGCCEGAGSQRGNLDAGVAVLGFFD